jgi:NAD(P)-dependent dehydrogenase (short-subunit alcohol dehydrogenase family)
MIQLSQRRNALVTGAGRGIGAAIAKVLATAGAHVGLVARSISEIEAVVDEIRRAGGSAEAIHGDLATEPERIAAAALERFGNIDILVNNAADQTFAPVSELNPHAFRESVAVNLIAPFILARALLPEMLVRCDGWIINIASDLAYRVRSGGAADCSTKRALVALSEVIQLEHRARGIRVSVILPGITATSWDGSPPDHPDKAQDLDPEDIAEAVLWCCTRRRGARIDSIVVHPAAQDS